MGDRFTALLVDQPGEGADVLARALEDAGGRCTRLSSAPEAIARLLDEPHDLIIASAELPGESGLAVLAHVHANGPRVPVLLLTDHEDAVTRAAHFGRGADDVLVRPVHAAELVARALRRLEVARELAAARAENARLHGLAVTDGLTGLANFRFFQERLREEFRRAQRYDSSLALVMMDLDHFKAVNDNFGHQAGDAVLSAAAQAVKQAVRETDLVARYGGEEFAMLLPQTHVAGALTVAERVSAGLRGLRFDTTPGLRVTGSFGLSGFPGRGISSAELLVRTADQALYRSKTEGRNKISLFQPPAGLPRPQD